MGRARRSARAVLFLETAERRARSDAPYRSRFLEGLHGFSTAHWDHEPFQHRRLLARVLDCGGKQSATPLFYWTLAWSRASLVIQKRRRRFAAKRHVVFVVPLSALPAQSKPSRRGGWFIRREPPSSRWRRQTSAARASATTLAFLGSVALLAVLIGWLVWKPQRPAHARKEPLLMYCAAGVLPPVEAVARSYEMNSGVTIQLQPGPSQTLLANIEITQRGDLFLPADDSYLALARDRGLIAETVPLARMTVMLAVRKGNPKNLRSLDDLLRSGVSIAQAGDAAAIGKLTRDALQKSGRWDEFERRVVVFKTTVTEVANDVKLGAVDAGFIWDALRQQYPDLDVIPIAALTNVQARVSVGVLRPSTQPDEALRFARHLGARDQGLIEFRRHGYEVSP